MTSLIEVPNGGMKCWCGFLHTFHLFVDASIHERQQNIVLAPVAEGEAGTTWVSFSQEGKELKQNLTALMSPPSKRGEPCNQ